MTTGPDMSPGGQRKEMTKAHAVMWNLAAGFSSTVRSGVQKNTRPMCKAQKTRSPGGPHPARKWPPGRCTDSFRRL